MSVVHVLITEQLHRSVPPSRSDDLVARQPWCAEDCDYCFLPLLGNNGDLDLAFLDVEDRIRRIPLCEDDPIFPIPVNAPSLADLGQKGFWIERRSLLDCHRATCSIDCRPGRLAPHGITLDGGLMREDMLGNRRVSVQN